MALCLLNGNEAAAEAVRLARVEVIPGYPITPESPLIEKVNQFIAGGRLDGTFIRVESDHSALAAAVGAALVGSRTFTGTNSQGLALMSEVVHHTAGLRLPVVMAVVNRALSAPHSRFPDHGDAIAQESAGWLQLYCENNQEVLDTIIQAFRIAEDERVRLPVMVNYEAYIQTHTSEPVHVPEQVVVDEFLPLRRRPVLDVDHPAAVNLPTDHQYYTEFKEQQHGAMLASAAVIREVALEFFHRFGRDWKGTTEQYRCEDAEFVMVTMGSMVSTAREAVDRMRAAGRRIGLLKVRSFRPFPEDEITAVAAGRRGLVVIDRNLVYGVGGALAREVKAALYGVASAPHIYAFVAGLGGRDVTVDDMEYMVSQVMASGRERKGMTAFDFYGLKTS